jgi:hypothetical protein
MEKIENNICHVLLLSHGCELHNHSLVIWWMVAQPLEVENAERMDL